MRILPAILLLCLTLTAFAREWKSELFRCAANIPESVGWQIIEPPQVPGIAVALAMQQPAKQAVFGINVVEKFRDASIADPAVKKELEAMLRQFGYQFFGYSTVKAGGFDWLQYPVKAGTGAQQISGLIRFTSAGGYVFSITMLRGGGVEAAQDAELQQAAASFRVLPAIAVAPAAQSDGAIPKGSTAPGSAPAPQKAGAEDKPAGETAEETGSSKYLRYVWIAFGVLFILSMFFGIIGTSQKKR